jgi:hypothetical protein
MIRRIDIIGIFTLLLYVFSNMPAVSFHHHNNHADVSEKTSRCQNAYPNAKNSSACQHNEHISEASKKCLLCDTNTLSDHSVNSSLFSYLESFYPAEHIFSGDYFQPITTKRTSNKGPPIV